MLTMSPSHPLRGASRVVTNVGEDAVDAERAGTRVRKVDGEVVWACRPDAGGKQANRLAPVADDGDTKAESHQGEHV